MRTLHADALVLEPLEARHAAEMFSVLSDPAIYEFENGPPESVEALEHRYRCLESRASADGSEQWLNWVVRLPSGELAGYVQATVYADGTAWVAYELASRHWRRGIGRAAVTAMIAELAGRHGVQTCLAVFKTRNFRSRGLLEALGFSAGPGADSLAVACEQDESAMHKRLKPDTAAL
jgi:ribosomal-protein-alanine N-acetyltransferase